VPKLEGKLALVTGASRGYGRAIADRLARDGAVVAVHYGSNKKAADATVGAIRAGGCEGFAVKGPLDGSVRSVTAMFAALDRGLKKIDRGPTIDILVNNAAVCLRAPIEETSEELFDEQFDINAKAPFFVTKAALPRIPDGGRIINISSQTSNVMFPNIAAYSMTKGAIDILTVLLAKQLGPRGITVNAVQPGVADTDMNDSWLPGNPEARAFASALSAFNRIADVTDIADVVGFLASNDGRWITGQRIDGGGGSVL
jgi:NAD(P)-dependent dehydrogenase (short-subunit alcohol dehydrogenase family)